MSIDSSGSELTWFKSSYSGSDVNSDCVEVASSPGTVHVRDSKNAQGGRLAFPNDSWSDFIAYAAYRA